MVAGGQHNVKFWVNRPPFQSISARSDSAVAPGKKLKKVKSKEVHYALSNEFKMNIVRCPKAPKGGLKR